MPTIIRLCACSFVFLSLWAGAGQAADTGECGEGWRTLGHVEAIPKERREGISVKKPNLQEIRFGASGGAATIEHVHLTFEQLGEWRLGQAGTLEAGEFSRAFPIPREYRDFRSISMEVRSPNTKTKVLVCGR